MGIPVLLLVIGAMGKWIMRGGAWDWEFAVLGPDLLLGSFGAELAYLCNFGKELSAGTTIPTAEGRSLIYCVVYLVVNVLVLVFAWMLHRMPPTLTGDAPGQRHWTIGTVFHILFIWNLAGIGLIVGFLILIRPE